jgi:hypothetical protein
MSYTYEEHKLYNPGIITTKIPEEFFSVLKEDVTDTINKKNNKVAAENPDLQNTLAKQYDYVIKQDFKDIIINATQTYSGKFDFILGASIHANQVCKINLQRKYEFFPSQTRSGALTWLLWLQIPYNLEDEDNVSSLVETGVKAASRMEFIYNTLDCGTRSQYLDVNQSHEGRLIMFPSFLRHAIHPFFTSDDHRVFMTGNVWISKPNHWRNHRWSFDTHVDWH